ncbi:hypothetical protein E2C01_036957 [Portunus trituberculatus]|uniref:Uncharacterized protein n=1 Tax=Portunus trituberculatus TaxID=210409 RepID=A0A5B7FDV6_PORTR|nr:hypothetical protein [Portunus trituberculatus]
MVPVFLVTPKPRPGNQRRRAEAERTRRDTTIRLSSKTGRSNKINNLGTKHGPSEALTGLPLLAPPR